MDPVLDKWLHNEFVWFPERGLGYYPCHKHPTPAAYDAAYFAKYAEYAKTPLGKALTAARLDLVDTHYCGPLLDVGVGCGQFVEARARTLGYDISPYARAWLEQRGLWFDPHTASIPAATFWDSLEHIPEPGRILDRISETAFVSLPIFDSCEHVLRSKHFRKDEHCWYWTHAGFVAWMRLQGFGLVAHDTRESDLGREGIGTYVFSRSAWD